MAIKPVMCVSDAPFIPECDPCEEFGARVDALEEFEAEARDTLSDHEQRITTNETDISALQTNLANNYYTKTDIDAKLTKTAILAALGYRETTITMTDVDGYAVTRTIIMKDEE